MITRRPPEHPQDARPSPPCRAGLRHTPARPGAGRLTARQRSRVEASSLNATASPAPWSQEFDGSRPCWPAVRSTLVRVRVCHVSAPAQVRLPPQALRVTTAGRMACSACQLVAWTPGTSRKVNRCLRLGGPAAGGWAGSGCGRPPACRPATEGVRLRSRAWPHQGCRRRGPPAAPARTPGCAAPHARSWPVPRPRR